MNATVWRVKSTTCGLNHYWILFRLWARGKQAFADRVGMPNQLSYFFHEMKDVFGCCCFFNLSIDTDLSRIILIVVRYTKGRRSYNIYPLGWL